MTFFKRIILSLCLVACSSYVFAQQFPARPNPPKLVNDFTNTLTPDQVNGLENKLVALDDATSTQIAVVIVESTNGASISDYNAELLRQWQVGSKAKNNGVVLLVAKNDRKLDIATGYGLEGALSDAQAKSIIDDIIVPNFKGQDYYRGISLGTDAIVQAVKGEYNIPRDRSTSSGGGLGSLLFLFIVMLIIFILIRKGGGGGGSYMSRRGQRGIADAIFWNTILNSGGGGGGWSGGGGGGGFGGFGGGSGGGGGASGSW
jgi:uncharacterized protein